MSELQDLVDDLASRINRSIALCDRRFSHVGFSEQDEQELDDARRISILKRAVPKEVSDWLASLNIERAKEPMRIRRNPAFGMSARICVPLRWEESLLGYMWLIDEPQPLSPEQIDEAARSAPDIGAALYRMERLQRDEHEREQAALRQLLGLLPGDSAEAAETLLSHSRLARDGACAVLAVAPSHPPGETVPELVRTRLACAMDQLRRRMAQRHLLQTVDGDCVIGVVAFESDKDPRTWGETLSTAVQDNLIGSAEWSATVAVGGTRSTLADIRGSYLEARRAITLARNVPDLGPLIVWGDLGAYRILSRVAEPLGEAPAPPDSLGRLLTSREGPSLVPTLEEYLEHAGDVRATAAALYVHKSSIYSRLRRIEEIAGVDLSSGDARLELHVGLRLRRMMGSNGD